MWSCLCENEYDCKIIYAFLPPPIYYLAFISPCCGCFNLLLDYTLSKNYINVYLSITPHWSPHSKNVKTIYITFCFRSCFIHIHTWLLLKIRLKMILACCNTKWGNTNSTHPIALKCGFRCTPVKLSSTHKNSCITVL